jgi:hypothetical protein
MTTFEFYPGNHIVSASQATFAEFTTGVINIPVSASVVSITQHPPGPKGKNFVTVSGTIQIL